MARLGLGFSTICVTENSLPATSLVMLLDADHAIHVMRSAAICSTATMFRFRPARWQRRSFAQQPRLCCTSRRVEGRKGLAPDQFARRTTLHGRGRRYVLAREACSCPARRSRASVSGSA